MINYFFQKIIILLKTNLIFAKNENPIVIYKTDYYENVNITKELYK